MSRSTANFIVGACVGACTALVVERLIRSLTADEPTDISEWLADRIELLEARVTPSPQPATR